MIDTCIKNLRPSKKYLATLRPCSFTKKNNFNFVYFLVAKMVSTVDIPGCMVADFFCFLSPKLSLLLLIPTIIIKIIVPFNLFN